MGKPVQGQGFRGRVFEACRKVPRGKVTTYRDIARKLGTSPRAVGQALRTNQDHATPCHRVVKSDLSVGGYQGKPNNRKKEKTLRSEGVAFSKGKVDGE